MRTRLLGMVQALAACRPPPGPPPYDPLESPVSPETVEVGHRRELRGVWIATVANIDFPSRPGLEASEQKAEIVRMLDLLAELRFNAVFFQVRPEADALYASEMEPWSRYLTGTQGKDPGYDPLGFLIEQAHARGIEIHAWFNPYRALLQRTNDADSKHVSVADPELVMPYGALLWMDPGARDVQKRTVATVLDVVRRYDVDGVHFDDYFYPYPNGDEFPDEATYRAYLAGGGSLSKADWRRHNVDVVLREVSAGIRAERPSVRFGVSPFGIYRPGFPEGVKGLDQVEAIYSDPLAWVGDGTVDYLAPQLYWPTTQQAQAYQPLLQWWAGAVGDTTYLYVGHFLSKVGDSPAWSVDEFRTQQRIARDEVGVGGSIWFSGKPLLEDRQGVQDLFRETYATQALTPPLGRGSERLAPPTVERDGDVLCIASTDPDTRSYVVYESRQGLWEVHAITSAAGDGHVDAPPGRYAVTSVDRFGVESPGLLIQD